MGAYITADSSKLRGYRRYQRDGTAVSRRTEQARTGGRVYEPSHFNIRMGASGWIEALDSG
jgi:hypothetical protein